MSLIATESRTDASGERGHEALVKAMSQIVRQAAADALEGFDGDALEDIDGRAGESGPTLTVERAAVPIAPLRLACHLGNPKAREQARQLYERCLAHYREQARRPGDDERIDDAGAAVARFVAVNIEALHGVHATPGMLRRLERQLAGVARTTSAWATAGVTDRQAYFEQMAILAVLVGASSAQAVSQGRAAIANTRRAARGYLKQLLGLDPDRLTLDADGGLSLRPA